MGACRYTTVEETLLQHCLALIINGALLEAVKMMINTLTTAIVFLIVIQTHSPLYTAVNKNEYHQLDWVHDITGNCSSNTSHW